MRQLIKLSVICLLAIASFSGLLDAAGTISSITWSEDGHYLHFKRGDESFRFDLRAKKLELQALPKAEIADPEPAQRSSRPRPGRGRQYMSELSPNDLWEAHCRDWNVVLENKQTGETLQVTTEGHRKFRYGTANWVYGEEIRVRHGMWWSADSKKLVYYVFDERPVQDFFLLGNLKDYNTSLLTEGYTKAGAPNPIVSLALYDLESGRSMPIDCGPEDQYLFNMDITADGKEMLFHRLDRRQKRLDLMALDFATGKTRIVVTETQETWQNPYPLRRFLEDGRRFIWETEKTGWRQYELRDLDGTRVHGLTHGDFPATSLVRVDEQRGWLYYTARSDEHPLCDQLHRARLDGSGQERLTQRSMNHFGFNFSADGKWFIARFENVATPPSTALSSTEGEEVFLLARGDEETQSLAELFSFKADDGATDLFGILYKPADFDPQISYPLLITVYGGPGSRAVRNRFSRGARSVTDRGYLLARIDNRGTYGRGKDFMGAVYEKLGQVDIDDQAQGVRYLRQRPYVDGSRVGIYGHSYGGYMAAMGVLRHPDVFHAASVRSAVTDWRQYDSTYTERYMNLPQDNPEGYRIGSCTPYVKDLVGHMLIMHGLVDDNVHPNNAWQLICALDEAGKKYESRFFPEAGHGSSGEDTQWEFFARHLQPGSEEK